MTAIVALAAGERSRIDDVWLERATEHSRSTPDGSGVHREDACALGVALLRTAAAQESRPLTLDGAVWLAADVRLDARDELMRALRVEDGSDAELVLRAYERWGDGFLDRLAGDFAFALWDGRAQRLICARDQLGVVPLHYAQRDGRLLVASAVDALLLHPAVPDTLDQAAIADFLSEGFYRDHAATAFAAIRQLPPAHVLIWSDGMTQLRRYWQLEPWEPLARVSRADEPAERFRELLDRAVADRLTCERATLQLTGGMDSTSIAASAAARQASGLRAFTGTIGAASGDREGDYATLVARELDIPLGLIDASLYAVVDPFAAPAMLTPEPTDYRPTDFAVDYARIPAQHSAVALSGQGGDVLLGFRSTYWLEWLARGRVARVAHAFSDEMRLDGRRPRTHLRAIRREMLKRPRVQPVDARALAHDAQWPALFRIAEPSFTSVPVRFRYPYLDLRLLRFVRSLPPDPWLVNKRVLRDSARGRLPQPVLQRKKTALVRFPSRVPHDLRPALAELVRTCPDLDRFLDRGAVLAALSVVADEPPRQRELDRSLGLAHWLWHRARP